MSRILALAQHNGLALTPEQEEAARCAPGITTITATAGAGKTTTVSVGIAALAQELMAAQPGGGLESRIWATTFTKAAAREMKVRIGKMLGVSDHRVQIGTLHGFCNIIIMRFGAEVGFRVRPVVMDEGDTLERLVDIAKRQLGVDDLSTVKAFSVETLKVWRGEFLAREATSDRRDWDVMLGDKPTASVENICRAYVSEARELGYLDYDMILTEALHILKKFAANTLSEKSMDFLRAFLPKFLYVDEAQDLSAVQWQIVEILSSHASSTTIIGDDDQSIYAWRGARPWRFVKSVKEANRSLFLSENRRCASHIVRLAEAVVLEIPKERRIAKILAAKRQEEGRIVFYAARDLFRALSSIANDIRSRVASGQLKFKDVAFIYRSKTHVKEKMEAVFKQQGLPYVVLGDRDSFDKPDVRFIKNLLAVIVGKQLDGGGGESPLHWLNLFKSIGLSADGAHKLIDASARLGGGEVTLGSLQQGLLQARFSAENAARARQLMVTVGRLRPKGTRFALLWNDATVQQTLSTLAERQVRGVLKREAEKRTGVKGAAGTPAELNDRKIKRLGSLGTLFDGFMGMSLAAAHSNLSLSSDDDEHAEAPDAVTITSGHSSKGLEWDTVFVMEVNDKTWPAPRTEKMGAFGAASRGGMTPEQEQQKKEAIEEERRLLYVAMTRAKNNLFLVSQTYGFTDSSNDIRSKSCVFLPAPLRVLANGLLDAAVAEQADKVAAVLPDHFI